MTKSKRKADDSESEAEVDAGRLDSQDMFSVIRVFKLKDDGWFKNITTQIDQDDKALHKILNDKERQLADVDTQFHNEVRSLLTDVLSPSTNNTRKKRGEAIDPRPSHDHAQLLFKQSQQILDYFKVASEAIEESDVITDQLQRFESDKKSVAELLHLGQEVNRRRIQRILKQPEDNVPRKKSRSKFSDTQLDEAAVIFEAVRQKDDTNEQDDVEKPVDEERLGIYPLIHNGKKGVKKLAGHLFYEEDYDDE